jgi:ABC-type transporter Mla maintaining outer membrane lipid asymmetry permease subunit MlaE
VRNLLHEPIRVSKSEQRVADFIAKFIVIILAIIFYILKLIVKLLNKFKKIIYKTTLMGIIVFFLTAFFMPVVYSPKANAQVPHYGTQTEHDQIANYIIEVFGDDAPKAFRLLECENHALNPNAVNDNTTWGGIGQDIGVFQINTVWQGVSNKAFLYDWRTNVDMAHNIYIRDGSSFKLWTCGKHLGI